jgi:hypothetical protein
VVLSSCEAEYIVDVEAAAAC